MEKQLFRYTCVNTGPAHLNQPPCGKFYTTKWLGEHPYCPNCGSQDDVYPDADVIVQEMEVDVQ